MADYMEYDYLIVGSGFFGTVCARELTDAGKKCLVIDRRKHIGGNCYTTNRDGIHVHEYGCHIFHTDKKRVWDYLNRFTSFNNFRYHGLACVDGQMYSLPFNMWTFHQVYGVTTPSDAMMAIQENNCGIEDPQNLEEQAIMMVGRPVYDLLIKGYTQKQWARDPMELPKEIIKRLPIRFGYDSNYFNDPYQGIPIGGYTQIFSNMLRGIEVKVGIDYKQNINFFNDIAEKTIYTGAIDELLNYRFGQLEYKTTRFVHELIPRGNYQGAAVINYPSISDSHTRIIEHKHFDWVESDQTWVSWEFPDTYVAGSKEPYYPVNDHWNNDRYNKYKNLAGRIDGLYLGGRLAEYKYYDMDDVIDSALTFVKTII